MHSGRGGGVNGRALVQLLLLLFLLRLRLRLLVLLQKAELCRHGKLPANCCALQSDGVELESDSSSARGFAEARVPCTAIASSPWMPLDQPAPGAWSSALQDRLRRNKREEIFAPAAAPSS
ncbi:hypothetical protein COCC4DRAFT_75102 [Bipolaris maydis ATCC 48331]|uniref:Uncharacterized protein n=2 Tax=Cochliobolus heterostrophus TaxID=5016 RepID=M2TJ75_COCH5|nr:uncharacterized protein COCC4DRAFT_75102 [Bipolaris maydis ATCC 48331]EMD97470.1 hypothetical protein COCHEDRAFT_1200162 [Bipolaris maydis C5]ENI01393.1 hypothetical protein COCC4DRAFT_75102 [Bipolaris maydis ATCC 48331]KAJ5052765.1 hypothetical protein J3E74DRAFT_478617 [Bipolaris maydis]